MQALLIKSLVAEYVRSYLFAKLTHTQKNFLLYYKIEKNEPEKIVYISAISIGTIITACYMNVMIELRLWMRSLLTHSSTIIMPAFQLNFTNVLSVL